MNGTFAMSHGYGDIPADSEPYDNEEEEDEHSGDDPDDLVMNQDTVEHDTFLWLVTVKTCSLCCWSFLILFLCMLGFALVFMTGLWATSELDAVADIYAVDCAGWRCGKKTYNDRMYKMEPCSRMSVTRCAMLPSNWVFLPMLPVYQWVANRNMFQIRQELPQFLRDRCLLCYGIEFQQ